MEQLANQGVYKRNFTNGFVVVNPTESDVLYDVGPGYEFMIPSGGGNVDGAGNPIGSLSWEQVLGGTVTIDSQAGMVFQSL